MSSAAAVASGNVATAGQIDASINVHRDKRSKPNIEVVAVEETGESVRRVCLAQTCRTQIETRYRPSACPDRFFRCCEQHAPARERGGHLSSS